MEIYFYKNLKYLRKVYKIWQEELSMYLQYSFQNISKCENDVSLPFYDFLLNIAKFFNMDFKNDDMVFSEKIEFAIKKEKNEYSRCVLLVK